MHRNLNTTIVLVNWNAANDSINCIESITKLTYFNKSINIIIVDNSSTDNSVENINKYLSNHDVFEIERKLDKKSFKRVNEIFKYHTNNKYIDKVVLIRAKKNYGFAKGNNIGLLYADTNFNSDYYWILNNDTEVASNSLSLMIKRISEENKICICGSTIIHKDTKKIVQCYGGSYYSLISGRGWSFGEGKKYNKQVTNEIAESKINYISGASMLLKADFIKKVGWFCEDYFLYNEEIDLSMRLKPDEKIAVATEAIVYHKIGASIGTSYSDNSGSKLAAFFQSKSKLIFARKHTPKNFIIVYCFLLARSIKFLLEKKSISSGIIILSVLMGRRTPKKDWFIKKIVNTNKIK